MLFPPIVLAILLPPTLAKVQSGSFQNEFTTWRFLSRFCFRSGVGRTSASSNNRKLVYTFDYEAKDCGKGLTLSLYYDSPEQWASVYGSNLTCLEKEIKARGSIGLTDTTGVCQYDQKAQICRCNALVFIDGRRARWWYLAISSCGIDSSSYNYVNTFNYTLTFTNGDNFYDKHFSADEIGIMEMTLISTIVMALIFVATTLYARLLANRRLYHATFKTFQVSVVFYFIRCVLAAIHYCIYGVQGHVPRWILQFSQLFEVASTCAFLGLLLSFANGYTIVASSLTLLGFGTVMSFTGLFVLFMFSCLIWEWNIFDPADVLYTYQSPPGYFVTAIYFPAWLYFIVNCAYTGFRFERKRKFYFALGLFYSIWLLAVPLVIITANRVIVDWVRMKTVSITQQLVWLLSYCYLLAIFTPTNNNKHFPFHLRASKVGGSDEDDQKPQDTNYAAELRNVESRGTDRSDNHYQNDNYTRTIHVPDIFTVA